MKFYRLGNKMHRFIRTSTFGQTAYQSEAMQDPPMQAPAVPTPPSAKSQAKAAPMPVSTANRDRLLSAVRRRANSYFADFSCAVPREFASVVRQMRPGETGRSVVSELQKTGVASPIVSDEVIKYFNLPQGLQYRFVEKMSDQGRIILLFGYNERERKIQSVKWVEFNEREAISIAKQGTRSRWTNAAERAGLERHQEALVVPTRIDGKQIDVLFVRNAECGNVEQVVLPTPIVKLACERQQAVRSSLTDLLALCGDKDLPPEAELIGLVDIGSDGREKITLHLESLLNNCLDDPDSSDLVRRIKSGKMRGDEQLRLLQTIVEYYQPEPGSKSAMLLEKAIGNLTVNRDSYRDENALFDLLHEAGTEIRTRARQLASWGLRAILVNALEEYAPPDGSEVRDEIRSWISALDWDADKEIPAADFQRDLASVREGLSRLELVHGRHLETVSTAPREAPRMPSECVVHWTVALGDVIEELKNRGDDDAAADIGELLQDAKEYWLHQDLWIAETRDYFANAAENCTQRGWHNLAEFANKLSEQLPSPDKEAFTANATRLLDNPYIRAYDTFLVDSTINTPNQGILDAVHEFGRWLSGILVPDPNNVTSADLRRVMQLQQNVRAKYWHWLPGLPALDVFARATEELHALRALLNYLDTPKTRGLDCIAIPYLVSNSLGGIPSEKQPSWLRRCNTLYVDRIKCGRIRIDSIDDVPKAYRKIAKEKYAESRNQSEYVERLETARALSVSTRKNMKRTGQAGTMMLHHPAAVKVDWMSQSIRPATYYKPDFSRLRKTAEDADAYVPGQPAAEAAPPNARFAQLERNGRFVGDVSGIMHLILHAAVAARDAGFQIDADALWKATAMLTTYNGGHQPEECYAVVIEQNESLALGIGDCIPVSADDEFSYYSLFTANGDIGPDYWIARSEEAFDRLRDFFKRESFYRNVGVTESPLGVQQGSGANSAVG
jgi:hypothetical protein